MTYQVESYKGKPQDEGFYYPPSESGKRFGISWPTGFSGTGWLARNADGEIVFAHAWRADVLAWVAKA